jgi:hypothetical protein
VQVYMLKQEGMSVSVCTRKHLIYELSSKNTFIISVENVIHEVHYTPQHISSSVQRCWIVANSLTGIHNVMVRCIFVVNSSCIHKTFKCPHRLTSRGFKSSKCGGHAVGLSLPIYWS